MAPIQPPQPGRDFGGYAGFEGDSDGFPRSRKVVRYGVPVAIAGVAAATIGLGTALASTGGSPSLPHITAEQLLDKIATSKVQTVSGSVQVTTNLGLPDGLLGGAMGGATGGGAGPFGQHGGSKGGNGGSAADPQAKLTELLSGTHTLRVAADGPDRQRVSIVDNTSEYTVVHNGDQMWAYDSASNAVYHQTGQRDTKGEHHAQDKNVPATPQEAVKQALKAIGPTTSVSVDGTAAVAGQHAYQLLIKPKQADSTVDSIRVAVDADNGVPLKFTLTPKGGGAAAVDIGYTKVDFGKPAASTFDFSVPKGAKVTEGKDNGQDRGTQDRGAQDHGGMSGLNVIGKDWDSVAELKSADAQLPSGKGGDSKTSAQGLLGSFGHQVKGGFGTGTVINTRLVNVLITDKGAVYAGAVNQAALVKAADSAAK